MAGRTEYLNLDDFEAKEDISFNEERFLISCVKDTSQILEGDGLKVEISPSKG